MGLFNKMFGKSDTNPQPGNTPSNSSSSNQPVANTDKERFEQEFLAAVPRYFSTPGASVNLRPRHPETHEVMSFAEGFAGSFEDWQTVRSAADRRGIIYDALDDTIGHHLKLWQQVARFTDDRYAERALELSKQASADDLQSAAYWAALAKTNFVLTNYPEAESNALKALEIDPKHKDARITLADIYHFTGKQEKAHEIYHQILNERLPKNEPMSLPITQLLGFEGDLLHSPIYASSWLKNDPEMNEETWNWAGEEFYYSPHFRSQHAYWLIEKGERMKGFVKLLTLSQEMPWFKEAVLNAYSLIGQLGIEEQMVEEKARLKGIIDQNGWTAQGLHTHTS